MKKHHINSHSTETMALMESSGTIITKPSLLRNVFVKALVFCVFIICFRFAYVITIRGESCDVGNFCFFSLPDTLTMSTTTATTTATIAVETDVDESPVRYYASVFQDLIAEGFLSPKSKSLVVGATAVAQEGVRAMKEVAVKNVRSFVLTKRKNTTMPAFEDGVFDFVFVEGGRDGGRDGGAGGGGMSFEKYAGEITRTIKPEGYLVVHTKAIDTYSLHSFIALFISCTFIKFHDINGGDNDNEYIREIVMKKEYNYYGGSVDNERKCEVVPGYKQEIVRKAENLIKDEPLKPWITLKRNIQNIKYLPNMVDISFKSRYVYVDVGARSYGSSIGSWFRKQYPKQNKTFEVYAIEADKEFYQEYEAKKKWVKLLPYAAWVKNETLFFEVNHDKGDDLQEKGASGRGMGRIKPVQSGGDGGVHKIQGFDFAEWLKATVTEKDFVVMKMDVEGTEFDLIPRLIETGAICLIDEIFLECHYNRWQRCCPGERSAKYEKTYGQCLNLFTSLRNRGVLVHQWW